MTANKLSAEPAYENAVLAAYDLLSHIREQLNDRRMPGDDAPIDWSHVGTACEVARMLADVVRFLEGNMPC